MSAHPVVALEDIEQDLFVDRVEIDQLVLGPPADYPVGSRFYIQEGLFSHAVAVSDHRREILDRSEPLRVLLIKKIAVVLVLAAVGIISLGYLPKEMSDRLTRALVAILILGFAIRVGAYFFG
jgi:lysylphosphatidylglycerol synthetase-like protein (DUF2156 family)